MRCKNKKNAFTLTELLVVVVIIGTLAVVILPKYNKVMETRKTTEAEEVMAAVRMEQEKRCALDKPYIAGEISKLAQLIPQNSSNFTYTLEETGMAASSQGKYSYNLKMPSYADGRICCDGDECEKLNKDYVKCTDLVVQEDYQVATECAAEPSTPPVVPCTDTPETSAPCETGCGTKTRPIMGCKDGKWEYGEWSTCAEKPDDFVNSCSQGCGTATFTYTCNSSTGEWTAQEGNCDRSECSRCLVSSRCEQVEIQKSLSFCSKTGNSRIEERTANYTCKTLVGVPLADVVEDVKTKVLSSGYQPIPNDCALNGQCSQCDTNVTYFQIDNPSGYLVTSSGWNAEDDMPGSLGRRQYTFSPQVHLMTCQNVNSDGTCPSASSMTCENNSSSQTGIKKTFSYSWDSGPLPSIVYIGGGGTTVVNGAIPVNPQQFYMSSCNDQIPSEYLKEDIGECRSNRLGQQRFFPQAMWPSDSCTGDGSIACCARGSIYTCSESVKTEEFTLP